MDKDQIGSKLRTDKFTLEFLLSDQSDWLRFYLFITAIVSFILFGAIVDQSILLALRWGAIPVFVFVICWIIGASYIQEIYELESYGACLNYLCASVFGFPLPTLKISGGRMSSDGDKENTLTHIGGPGMLFIEPGNAVILETFYGPSRILGSGEHRIFRFEIIKEVISLEEQFGRIQEIPAITRDGIEITVKNVTYGFCVFQAHQKRTSENPYPFSEKGIYNMTYYRSVGEDGKTGSWSDAVQGVLRSVITTYIATNDLDALTAPNVLEAHPLDALRSNLESQSTQQRFESIGAQLEWHNIGSLEVNSTEVDLQRLNAWIVRQAGKAKIVRAQGESENLASQERGRAEGQVALLKSIAQALQDINFSEEASEARTYRNLRNIVLARTAQILESMTSIYKSEDIKDGNDDS